MHTTRETTIMTTRATARPHPVRRFALAVGVAALALGSAATAAQAQTTTPAPVTLPFNYLLSPSGVAVDLSNSRRVPGFSGDYLPTRSRLDQGP